jgi:oxygen-independent coproporphyrinogen-3 oxidase
LPTAEEKREQYELGKSLLAEVGYSEIGMDHFSLKTDSLYKAMENGTLHRNFMGYTASKTRVMVGLGISSISDSWDSFAQNVKSLEEYSHLVESNIIPIYRGHILTDEDRVIRKHILNLMCKFRTTWKNENERFDELDAVKNKLKEMAVDGLVEIDSTSISVTEKGRPFVRNVCMAFDLFLHRKAPNTRLFSMTI